MFKAKKIVAMVMAISIMAVCAVPAFAASDGWTNVTLPSLRNSVELARAKVSSSSNSEGAAVEVTKLTGTDTMYFDIFQYVGGERVNTTYPGGFGRTAIPYNYPVAQNLVLQLKGGNDSPFPGAITTGSCNFG